MGVPVNKAGAELHSDFKEEDVAGYKLERDTGFDRDEWGHKYRTADELKQGKKPIIVSVDEFNELIRDAATGREVKDSEKVAIDRPSKTNSFGNVLRSLFGARDSH